MMVFFFSGSPKMKDKMRYKLSPNEQARLLKEETDARRKLRILQVIVFIGKFVQETEGISVHSNVY